MAVDRKNLCPNCGAPLSGLELKCPECGYTLMNETARSQSTTDAILDLQEKLLAVDKVFSPGVSSSKKKASIINSFPVPNTAESLSRLLHLSYSNYEACKESGDKKLTIAWLGKAVESYRRLEGIKENTSIKDLLEKYKVLGDKKAVTKLSGNYKKRRWTLFSCLAGLALLVAFILFYDWPSLLINSGNEQVAARLLGVLGREDKAIEVLTGAGLYEKAADMLYARGQVPKAIAILAQNGLIKEALIMCGRTNSPDSIHLYVDEIGKFSLLNDRMSYKSLKDTLKEYYVGLASGADSIYTQYYRADKSLRRVQMTNLRAGSTIWRDYLAVMNDITIPEPCEFKFPQFVADYYFSHEFLWRLWEDGDPEIRSSKVIRYGDRRIAKIDIPYFDKTYEFDHSGPTGLLTEERISYKGIPTMKVIYDYGNRGHLLSTVNIKYLLERSQIDTLFQKDEAPSSKLSSNTYHYDYKNGRLNQIIVTLDEYDDFPLYYFDFEYYGNLRIRRKTTVDYPSKEQVVSDDVTVEYCVDDKYVESFVISLKEPSE